MHEIMQPVYVDKYQADQGRQKSAVEQKGNGFPQQNMQFLFHNHTHYYLQRIYVIHLSPGIVAIDA